MTTKKPQTDYRAIARELHDNLKRISKCFMSPEQIRRAVKRPNNGLSGLDFAEALEMAYENMQDKARQAIAGKRRP